MSELEQIVYGQNTNIQHGLMSLSTRVKFRVDSLTKLRHIAREIKQSLDREMISLRTNGKVTAELKDSIQKLISYKQAIDIQRLNVEMKNLLSDYSTISELIEAELQSEHYPELKKELEQTRLGLDLIYDQIVELFDFFEIITSQIEIAQKSIDEISLERVLFSLDI